jgi:Ca2+-transporting ATPase
MPNHALWWVVGGAIGGLAVALYLPAMQAIFRFEALAWYDLLFCAVAASAGILWSEIAKVLPRMQKNQTARQS